MQSTSTAQEIAADTTIGAVVLTTPNLDRALTYYKENIGLELLARQDGQATLGAGDTPLLILRAEAKTDVVSHATGLFHCALLVPSRLELARILQHLIDTETPISGASDHRVSEALYLTDPDGHGIEIYRDRPRDTWYDTNDNFVMTTERLDIDGLLGELKNDTAEWNGLHAKTVMGHVHLRVADVDAACAFYTDVLGFGHMTDYPSASFVSAGGYHHHIGMNMWQSAGAEPAPDDAARLLFYEIHLPDQNALDAVVTNVRAARVPITQHETGWLLRDPAQNGILLRVK